jgi:hypothetical protein
MDIYGERVLGASRNFCRLPRPFPSFSGSCGVLAAHGWQLRRICGFVHFACATSH